MQPDHAELFARNCARCTDLYREISIQDTAFPHLIVDDIFSDDLVALINKLWPQEDKFINEVPGNKIFIHDKGTFSRDQKTLRDFWTAFDNILWDHIIKQTVSLFHKECDQVYGALYPNEFAKAMPMTLMQANKDFMGHPMHTHFYHGPHWTLTFLLYIDPCDKLSPGTTLHRLLPRGEIAPTSRSSYSLDEPSWRVDVAMHTMHWLDPEIPDRVYEDLTVPYRANRLLVFMDGPLALHSVQPPPRLEDRISGEIPESKIQRRIIRQHLKVKEQIFMETMSPNLPELMPIDYFAKVMVPNASLDATEQLFWDGVARPFVENMFALHSGINSRTASQQEQRLPRKGHLSKIWRYFRNHFT